MQTIDWVDAIEIVLQPIDWVDAIRMGYYQLIEIFIGTQVGL